MLLLVWLIWNIEDSNSWMLLVCVLIIKLVFEIVLLKLFLVLIWMCLIDISSIMFMVIVNKVSRVLVLWFNKFFVVSLMSSICVFL